MKHEITSTGMTSMERTLLTLGHKEPDRVPLFLLLSMYGAREMGTTVKHYFSNADHVVKTQLHMADKYRNDCLYAFSYAALEVEACGGEVLFPDDGPPVTGEPILKIEQDILAFIPPDVSGSAPLLRVLEAISGMKAIRGNTIPIIGVVMSPFSLPVMQMGFDHYLDLMTDRPEIFQHLMEKNIAFCLEWANAQLQAGASAICYFDPVSSPTIISPALYRKTGFEIARRTLAGIKGPTATHLASGRCLPIADELQETGTAIIGVSSLEDMAELKARFIGKLSLLGNLNGIGMCHWSETETVDAVRDIIKKAATGGGLILSDNHGEIPLQVPENTLKTLSEAVMEFGRYPTA